MEYYSGFELFHDICTYIYFVVGLGANFYFFHKLSTMDKSLEKLKKDVETLPTSQFILNNREATSNDIEYLEKRLIDMIEDIHADNKDIKQMLDATERMVGGLLEHKEVMMKIRPNNWQNIKKSFLPPGVKNKDVDVE